MIFHLSAGIQKIPRLAVLLGNAVSRYQPWSKVDSKDWIAGWGAKPSAERGRRLADKLGQPFLCLEDGFIRSVGLGNQDPPLSIVRDRSGIYFDASRPSDLEAAIAAGTLDNHQVERCKALIKAWREARVSKYNHQPDFTGHLPQRYVLAVDQTFGDASISLGMAAAESFRCMLAAALDENLDCTVVLKIHPDVFIGKKRGHFTPEELKAHPRLMVLSADVHPASLLENAEAVYVVTSQMGFEGLLWGKKVRTFGMPFYAGWGLTTDDLPAPERRRPVSLDSLVYAALISYPRYLNPENGELCEAEDLIAWMGLQRRMRGRFPSKLNAIGFSKWKRPIVNDFFGGSRVDFLKSTAKIRTRDPVIIWGMKDASLAAHRAPPEHPVIRVEDGFLRSVGLGADLVRPLSWVIDMRGIYYDSRHPSDLEHLLQTFDFDDQLRIRAGVLRHRVIAEGLTKYNVGNGEWVRPLTTKRVILVPGQVETDASLAFGAPGIRRNMDLLQAVRTAHPDAYVVYKPHPDVVAGLRKQGQKEDQALQWCDEVVADLPMGRLLDVVDEVHVLTSLAGFEALLRNKKVETYGQPFYSGWGLTVDHCPVARRTRQRTLDELVAGTLILYPTYVSLKSRRFTTPENALDELLEWRQRGPTSPGPIRKLKRLVLRRIVGVR